MDRCLDCGMLCVWGSGPNHEFRSLDPDWRRLLPRKSQLPPELSTAKCGAGLHDKLGKDAEEAKRFILEERECAEFIKYFPALETPRGHIEMLALKEAQQAKQESTAALKDSATAIHRIAEFHREIRELTAKFQEWQIQQAVGTPWYKSAVFWAAVSAVAAIGSAVAAIMK